MRALRRREELSRQRKAERQLQSRHLGCGAQVGGVFAGCGSRAAALQTGRGIWQCSSVTGHCKKKLLKIHGERAARSCSYRTGRRKLLRLTASVSGLAANTNSITCDGRQRPETANGCLVLQRQESRPRGPNASCGFSWINLARSSKARVSRSVFSLDNRLHGCLEALFAV